MKVFCTISLSITLIFTFLVSNVFADEWSPVNWGNTHGFVQSGECINTAIGCFSISSKNAFTSDILTYALGIAGGIAFLLIAVSGFQIMASSGNPDTIKAAKQLLTSAIMGLILLVFSVFILRVIGVDILNIPGFSE